MPAPAGITGLALRKTCAISLTPMLPGAGTATWINITSATPCSNYPVITLDSGRTSRSFCVLPAQGGMIRSASLSLSMNWKNICLLFPLGIYAWIPLWTITPPTVSLKTEGYDLSSTSTINAAGQKQFLILSLLTKMGLPYVRKTCA